MPSKTAVPYMNAWVMMFTFASRSGTEPPWKYVIRSSVEGDVAWAAGTAGASVVGFSVSIGTLLLARRGAADDVEIAGGVYARDCQRPLEIPMTTTIR